MNDSGGTASDGLVLQGFLAPAPQPGMSRLYLDAELRDYLTFEDSAIQESDRAPEDKPSLPAVVRLRAEATVTLVETSRHQFQAGFLKGSIVDRAMPPANLLADAEAAAGFGTPSLVWSVIKDTSKGRWCGETIACTHCGGGPCGKTAPGPDDVTYWC